MKRPRSASCLHIARSGLNAEITRQIRQAHVSRSGFDVDAGVHALNRLIARTGFRPNLRIRGCRDLVVDGNILMVHIVNSNIVSALLDGRVPLDVLDLRLLVTTEPTVSDVNMADDANGTGGSAANGYITGPSEHLQVCRSSHIEALFKTSLLGSRCQAGCEQKTQSHCR